MTESVLYEVRDRFAWITLNRPERRNAFGFDVVQGLDEGLEQALGDDAVRGLVLTHTGPVFCAGADLKMDKFAAESGRKSFDGYLASIWKQLYESPKPVVARLAGGAYGAGVGLVASCDIVVAAEGVKLAISELRWGRAGGAMALRLWLKGALAAANPWFLTGEPFDAQVAREMHLVHQVVPEAGLDAAVADLLGKLRLSAPGAMARYKANVRAMGDLTVSQAFARQEKLSAQMFVEQDAEFVEGKTAFREKRKPNWAL